MPIGIGGPIPIFNRFLPIATLFDSITTSIYNKMGMAGH